MNCQHCDEPLESSGGNRQRRYCDDRCRKAAARATARASAPPTAGQVRHGLREWLDDHAGLPQALVSAAETLAAQIDAQPADSALWSRYLATLAALSGASQGADQEAQRVLANLRVESDVIMAAETIRAQKYRDALAAGDEREARRWDRMVPAGCARGEHRWHRWPAGRVACVDCQAEPEAVDA